MSDVCLHNANPWIWIADILKYTNKSNQDYSALEQALNSIREVMTHINEDKRKTEGQLVMFDIFNDIENCPVSSFLTTRRLCFVTTPEGSMMFLLVWAKLKFLIWIFVGSHGLSLCTCGVSTFCGYGTRALSVEGGGRFMPMLHWVTENEPLRRCVGLGLVISKGSNWLGVFPLSPEDGNRSSFRNVEFSCF
jgi:hypothetical protein